MVEKQKIGIGELSLLILIAYAFSFAIRMIWVYQFQGNLDFYWNGELMINTNDGYTWAAGAQHVLFGMHEHNPGIRDMWDNGVIFFTVLFTKITPFSFETILLYMPTIISSLVVIPIILITRLYNQALWGFLAALFGSIAWSYYNRTMTGYYDTDMFSAMAPMFILYFLMKSTMDFTPRSALYAAIAIALYPFLYDAGKSIVYAMGIIYAMYMMFSHRNERETYISMILVFVALVPFPLLAPFSYLVKIVVLILLYQMLNRSTIEQKKLMIASAILFLLFMYFGNVFDLIFRKVTGYLITGTANEGLHFYSVVQTIREAGKIPFETFANRISGSQVGVFIAFLGYGLLVVRHRAFILALPLIGIGAFALWGGLRFTVYAVPVAAMAMVYFFYYIITVDKQKVAIVYVSILISFWLLLEQLVTLVVRYMPAVDSSTIGEKVSLFFSVLAQIIPQTWVSFIDIFEHGFQSNRGEFYDIIIAFLFLGMFVVLALVLKGRQYKLKTLIYMTLLTALFLVPNITHIVSYKVPTVLSKAEVQDLETLKQISNPDDYTLAWWDYGYPIWYYSETSTLIDGGKHNNDNFIISKIMQTSSKDLAVNLGRLAVETYVDSNYRTIVNTLFNNGTENQLDPNLLLLELESSDYELPKKTRDIYLYLPYKMLNIFPTVAVFGNLDLRTGRAERRIAFYPTKQKSNKDGVLTFKNGIIFDMNKGIITLGKEEVSVKHFVISELTKKGQTKLHSQRYTANGQYSIVYLKSYGKFIVMDSKTFNSTYVQMFMLGKYDKDLFELVVSSPYSKIYKLKK
ncbi:MAG: peptide-binding protein [Sulfurovum sp.]|nr:peptide-binding protein [Sulfurovum sp.]